MWPSPRARTRRRARGRAWLQRRSECERYGASVAFTSSTKPSTWPSTVPASALVRHEPASIALAYAAENFVPAVMRHVESVGCPLPTAFAWHLSFANAFFPAAVHSFDVHLLAVVMPLSSVVSRPVMTPSTLPSIVPASVVVRQSPAVTAFPYAVENFVSAIMRHVGSVICPLPTAFA